MTFKSEAFVLKTKAFKDADRFYYLFTPHEGMVTAVLKSAAKSGSKLAGHLPVFAKVRVMIGRGKIDHLAGVELVEDFPNLRNDLKNLALASSIAEIFLNDFSFGQKQAEFKLLNEVLFLLNSESLESSAKLLLVRAFLWKFLALSGFSLPTFSISKTLLQLIREILKQPLVEVLNFSLSKELNKEWLQASQVYYQEVYDRPSQALKLFVYG